jgi:hypothetical protein
MHGHRHHQIRTVLTQPVRNQVAYTIQSLTRAQADTRLALTPESSAMISLCFFFSARLSAVLPCLSRNVLSMPRSSSSCAISSLPFCAACSNSGTKAAREQREEGRP